MPELSVSRKSISQLLTEETEGGERFLIPEYQRPYKWDQEKCDILWNDIANFHFEINSKNSDGLTEYFLGTIVTCRPDKSKNIEIIDGQQRITSIFLLLRAFYTKLEKMPDTDDVIGLKAQIAPCIWAVDSLSQKVKNYAEIHISSEVATAKDNEVFQEILKTGAIQDSKSLYNQNYGFFLDKCNEYAENNPMDWKNLCITFLKKCIILPIECDTLDSALMIFSTLNDRGMPLSDSDIFKAQIYKTKTNEKEKRIFTDKWKELTEIVEDSRMSLDDIFRYYSHIIRAKNDDKSKEIALRKFYAEKAYDKLKNPEIMDELIDLAKFWNDIYSKNPNVFTQESLKYIQCLSFYPNEYWKYVTSVFYYVCVQKHINIKIELAQFLQKIAVYLLAKFIYQPTVNAIKDDVFAACVSVYKNETLKFNNPLTDEFEKRMSWLSTSKITKSLLLLHAYLFDDEQTIIADNCEIEHIFPSKWQDTNYNGWQKEEAEESLNRFGNKIIFEKKLNIQAGNGYFGKKKEKYLQSKIKEVIALGNTNQNDWTKESIENREKQFCKEIRLFFEKTLGM
jgi:uncharacterized protein with ParB-like and HNH nuclease domain